MLLKFYRHRRGHFLILRRTSAGRENERNSVRRISQFTVRRAILLVDRPIYPATLIKYAL